MWLYTWPSAVVSLGKQGPSRRENSLCLLPSPLGSLPQLPLTMLYSPRDMTATDGQSHTDTHTGRPHPEELAWSSSESSASRPWPTQLACKEFRGKDTPVVPGTFTEPGEMSCIDQGYRRRSFGKCGRDGRQLHQPEFKLPWGLGGWAEFIPVAFRSLCHDTVKQWETTGPGSRKPDGTSNTDANLVIFHRPLPVSEPQIPSSSFSTSVIPLIPHRQEKPQKYQ